MKKIWIVVLAVAGLASTLTAPPVTAAGINGVNLDHGRELNGADLGGLSLVSVILPEGQEGR